MRHLKSKSERSESKARVPAAPLVLGAAGLMPFLFLSAALVLDNGSEEPTVRAVLLAYSIAILSFMGAVHWGLAMNADDMGASAMGAGATGEGATDEGAKKERAKNGGGKQAGQHATRAWRRYGISVVPALAATATVFVPPRFQFFWLGGWFLALLAYDVTASRRGEVPGWYANLRWALTLIVCVCLGAAGLRA